MKETVVAILGPTAVGKTKLSIEVAKAFNGEIISGDSMQIYKSMDIGTAKIKEEEKQGIPHYMIDIKKPDESFTVAEFKSSVEHHIREISKRKNLPILVGGSGFYVQSVLYDFNFANVNRNKNLTNQYEKEINQYGIEPMYNRMSQIDHEQAKKIHPNNHRRVIRALEIYETTGLTMSDYQKRQTKESPYNIIFIGLEMERALLYDRINARVEKMMKDGLLEEVRGLVVNQSLKHAESMQAIGYKEFIPYFEGEYSLDRAIELLKRNSRRYAKRQYTWFKNKLNIPWYNVMPNSIEETFRKILGDLAGLLEN